MADFKFFSTYVRHFYAVTFFALKLSKFKHNAFCFISIHPFFDIRLLQLFPRVSILYLANPSLSCYFSEIIIPLGQRSLSLSIFSTRFPHCCFLGRYAQPISICFSLWSLCFKRLIGLQLLNLFLLPFYAGVRLFHCSSLLESSLLRYI